ncbi:RSP_2648 family PIN domain-containing protein [Roseobacter sp. HKCCA0434]|uniref:RSP_2648 family PIN domain-containing protein n=1 Tax=Roseobacter sp. HKCCA0434 TaxID=3079297 RepID=UPI002905E7A9|nr:PIN domain-containing protein [Roseobacter sp. HKCCA0434]
MRAVLDACVLYPTVLREILLGVAARGDFAPVWSERILGEWARAAERTGVGAQGRVEIAGVEAAFPAGKVSTPPRDDLHLPDPDDVHVLATALEAGAQAIITLNLKDFPARALGPHGVYATAPDVFLLACHEEAPVNDIVEAARAKAERLSGEEVALRPLLKRARLPRLGKALA